jgi:hypothetical protein
VHVRQRIDPDVEYDRGAVLWAAVTMVLVGLVVNFVLYRPGWLVPGAAVAGGVAAARSGYYQPSGNNGAIGVVIGMLLISPVLAAPRVGLFADTGSGDVAFLTIALTLGWVAGIAIVVIPVGYLGALVVDYTRKKVGGPIGY